MESKLQKIKIERTAHIYTMGQEAANAKQIWLVFHGYGQLASRIIRKFDGFEDRNIHVIAPEGFSKFYFKRNPLVLGASWMTKRHREDEIEDYLHYIDQIFKTLDIKKDQSFNVLGFSQGSATMMRWLNHARPKVTKVVNWAGEFPPDLDYSLLQEYLDAVPKKYYCVGDQDEFISSESIESLRGKLASDSLDFEIRIFEGTHEINRALLSDIISE